MRSSTTEEPPEGFGFLVGDVMEVPEKDEAAKEVLKKTTKTRMKSMGGVLEGSSGFIPPSKQKNMQMRRSKSMASDGRFDSAGSVGGRSKSSDGSRGSIGSTGSSRVSRLSIQVAQQVKVCGCGCGYNHDEKGRCIKTDDSYIILKQRRRQLGLKPAKCDSAGDGLFVQKPKKKSLPKRSRTFDFGRSCTVP